MQFIHSSKNADRTGHILDFVYRQLPVALIANIFCAVALGMVVLKSVPWLILTAWFAFISVTSAIRVIIYFQYFKLDEVERKTSSRRFYVYAYYLGVASSGISWGASIYFLFFSQSPTVIILHILILAGLSAGAIAANAVNLLGYSLFIVPVLIPFFLWMAFHADPYFRLTSWSVLLFMGMLYVIARSFRKQYIAALTLASTNEKLVSQLSTTNMYLAVEVEERKKTELELRKAKENIEIAFEAKAAFFSHMSHELRTPLNAIIGFSELALQTSTSIDDHRRYAEMSLSAGNHLLKLVNDVLDLAKLEAHSVEVEARKVDMTEMIYDSLSLIQPHANKRHINISFNPEKSCTGNIVSGDPVRIKQVLLNLLSNAIKYNCENGRIEIRCKIDHGTYFCSISDTGRGIRPERLNDLFTPFNRLDSETSDIEGSGIGLVITKQLLNLMQGDIVVKSELDVGTSFTFNLPLASTEFTQSTISTPITNTINNDKLNKYSLRVLVAEDNLPNQMIIQKQLEKLGCKADVVNDGKQAFDRWQHESFDLLLTDFNMPEMNGIELTRSIRTRENGKHIPIIGISADVHDETIEKCMQAGMTGYITKPVTLEQLNHAIGIQFSPDR